MKAHEIRTPGFYWWCCPPDDGPKDTRGRPATVVQVGVEAFGMRESPACASCYLPGSSETYITSRLPGEFFGPIAPPRMDEPL